MRSYACNVLRASMVTAPRHSQTADGFHFAQLKFHPPSASWPASSKRSASSLAGHVEHPAGFFNAVRRFAARGGFRLVSPAAPPVGPPQTRTTETDHLTGGPRRGRSTRALRHCWVTLRASQPGSSSVRCF